MNMARFLLPLVVFVAAHVATMGADPLQIAVIPKGTTHNFWKSVEAGAKQAAAELGVNVIWKGPVKEDDRAQQIALVQQFVSSKVDAIVLAPLDETALVSPVTYARERGIPVVIIDSALKGEAGVDFVNLVATDNYRGGQMGGEELVRLLGGSGKVVLLRCFEGSASTDERESGFLEVMRRSPGIDVIVDNRYGGATVASAQESAMNLLDRLRAADGIFCPNESTTQGMLLALRRTGLAGKRHFVGFDTSPFLMQALNSGEVHALVAQNPRGMGYHGVISAVRNLRGEVVERRIDTGCVLVTKGNQSAPEIRAILAN